MLYKNSDYKSVDYHFRTANYLTTAQLFLKNNVLLREKLKYKNLKEVVLGHFGACPGINFLYSHFCKYIRDTNINSYLVLGSGHAAPALLANLYLERSLGEIYPDLDYGIKGLYNFISKFGLDPRLQTEISSTLPGVINAGGDLGTALACSIGSILNNPKKVSFCIVGDGEFEAGSTMPSLLCREFLAPKKDGFLILAINLNKYKMGSRSILSTWSNDRINYFFSSLGMEPFICELSHDQCGKIFLSIDKIYKKWASGINIKLPVIILKNQKGMTAPKEIDGEKFVGTHRSHKVGKLKHPKPNHAEIIEKWLKSYKPEELFQKNGFPTEKVKNNFPKENLRIGRGLEIDRKKQKEFYFNKKMADALFRKKGQKLNTNISPMEIIGDAINYLKKENKKFILFSPDEGFSNKLGSVIEKNGIKGNPKWESSAPIRSDGGVVEILNENCCHGMLQGYTQTGRDGLYVTYEAFAPVTASLISQYYKFLEVSNFCTWRTRVPSLKYILTSLGWRNSYTHQNPDLLNTLLSKKEDLVEVYFPSDPNQALVSFVEMLKKKNSIQVQVVGKTNFKVMRSIAQAKKDIKRGFWTRNFGTKNKENKKISIIAIGDYLVKEVIDTCDELIHRNKKIDIKLIFPICSKIFQERKLKKIFNKDDNFKKVIFVCSGYINIFRGILGSVYNTKNWKFLGYNDGFSFKKSASVLDANKVSKDFLIKEIEKMYFSI